jgi:hypothetical protein
VSTASIVILVVWDSMLLVALWLVATRLHEHVHPTRTPVGEIARQWCMGMALFVALLSAWPQSVLIAAVALSVYVTWGAVAYPLGIPDASVPRPRAAQPEPIHADRWQHVSGGSGRQDH